MKTNTISVISVCIRSVFILVYRPPRVWALVLAPNLGIYFSGTRATAFAIPGRPIRPALNLTTTSAPSIPASSPKSEAPPPADHRRLFGSSHSPVATGNGQREKGEKDNSWGGEARRCSPRSARSSSGRKRTQIRTGPSSP
jgi:hypothetical protein